MLTHVQSKCVCVCVCVYIHWKFLVPSQTRRRLYVSSKAGVTWPSMFFPSTTLIKCTLMISMRRILACMASELRVCKDIGCEAIPDWAELPSAAAAGTMDSTITFKSFPDTSLLLLSGEEEREDGEVRKRGRMGR